jgi:DNA-directed RNA polymerase subunit RPC12/RpoP
MWKSDIICPECGAGYRRVVITSCEGAAGEYRCLTCDRVLEVFDGSFAVLIRLTVPPEKNASMTPKRPGRSLTVIPTRGHRRESRALFF